MAATGFTPISLYYSSTASTAPTAGNLVNGELAINITDGKLYYKDNAGAVQLLASKTSVFSTYTTGDMLYASATNVLSKLGVGSSGQILSVVGGVPTWTAAPPSGASISNDTSTASNLYPLFSNTTTGAPTTIYTSNAKYLYKPSTGDLQSSQLVASNGIISNSSTVAVSYTISTGNNSMSVGPITVASGQSVTVPSGSRWVVL